MQKCSLCGGRVVNGRCEECGMPIPPERTYTLRGESAHYHQVNGEDVLHRVRPSGSRPKVNGYDEEERTAHVHASGTDRHDTSPRRPQSAPTPKPTQARPTVHTQPRRAQRPASRFRFWFLLIMIAMAVLPSVFSYIQRLHIMHTFEQFTGSNYTAESPVESAAEEAANAYEPLRAHVPADGEACDLDLTPGLYVAGQDIPAGTYTIHCCDDSLITMQIVNDAYNVTVNESFSSFDEDYTAREDIPLPAGTVFFLDGTGALSFHADNGQTDGLPEMADNPLTDSFSVTLEHSEDGSSASYTVGDDIAPGVYDVLATGGSGYFSFELAMQNSRTMYCDSWLYADDTYRDTLQHIVLQEGSYVTVSTYNDAEDFSLTLIPSETVYIHE